jgi:hypothetical protein
VFDDKDEVLKQRREVLWNSRPGPRVGDFVIMPGEEEPRRFTHDWDDTIQTTTPRFGLGSFYFDRDGYADYSGALDPSIPKADLKDTGRTKDGQFWFFHHDSARAHNGVYFTVPCRVFIYEPKVKQ